MNDAVIAFVMDCDQRNLSYEEGILEAHLLADELVWAAEDRIGYAKKDNDEPR